MKILLCLFLMGVLTSLFSDDAFSGFKEIYPMGDLTNIRYVTPMNSSESIIFEANPVMRYSFYNNFIDSLMDASDDRSILSWGTYVVFKPQIRMYNQDSNPVKMPSYKIQWGSQTLIDLNYWFSDISDQTFLGLSFEDGHYSNGQAGGAFAEGTIAGTVEAEAIYETIDSSTDLSEILNRTNGDFSTNLTEITVSLKSIELDKRKYMEKMSTVSVGYTWYHKYLVIPYVITVGGYSDNDIKLYGKHRLRVSGEYVSLTDKNNFFYKRLFITKMFFNIDMETIFGAHDSVNPYRYEFKITSFFIKLPPDFGVVTGFIYGHDNYNLRFVDEGFQLYAGFTWESFSRIQMKKD